LPPLLLPLVLPLLVPAPLLLLLAPGGTPSLVPPLLVLPPPLLPLLPVGVDASGLKSDVPPSPPEPGGGQFGL
jgi:hypothetical protein